MVRIRLRRTGKKKQPSYRVVVADVEAPRDGRFIESIGYYNPRTDPLTVEINAERLSQGAQPSDAVARLLRKQGILAQFEASKGIVTAAKEPAVEAEVEAVPAAETTLEETSEEPAVEAAPAAETTLEETPEEPAVEAVPAVETTLEESSEEPEAEPAE